MWILHFVLLFQDYFGYSRSIEIPYEFQYGFFYLQKKKPKHILDFAMISLNMSIWVVLSSQHH